jgi:hypothetical protein
MMGRSEIGRSSHIIFISSAHRQGTIHLNMIWGYNFGVGCYAMDNAFYFLLVSFLVFNINVVLVTIIYLFLGFGGANFRIGNIGQVFNGFKNH